MAPDGAQISSADDEATKRAMFKRLAEFGAEHAPELPSDELGSVVKRTSPHVETPNPSAKPTAQDGATAAIATRLKDRPKLRGVMCNAGHFTAPTNRSCQTCDIAIEPDAEQVKATRPVLGHLLFDDGVSLNIDRPVVIGANVPAGYTIEDEPTTIVRFDDGREGIADVQLEFRPSGWDIQLVDLASGKSTYTFFRGMRQTRTKLRSGQELALQDGITIEIGTRTLTFGLGPRKED